MTANHDPEISTHPTDAGALDHSDPGGDDFTALSRDRILIRSMTKNDLDAMVRLDKKLVGRERRDYYIAKLNEVMSETGVRVSLVAEVDDRLAGFIMARVDFGEFGQTEQAAVIDTLGVDPGLAHHGIASALLSQLLINLDALHVERVQTRVLWNNFGLMGFLARNGFSPNQALVLTKTVAPA
ncbi:MAG: GNAT family N-acetyltransferase [Rhodospirillales bacterium]|nr:GNAT family N-acetyltransferase [Rhodospirillales bacterium]